MYYRTYNSKTDQVGYTPAWKSGEQSRLFIFSSPQPIQTRFIDSELLVEEPVEYGKYFTMNSVKKTLLVNKDNRLYAHLYLCRNGVHPDPDRSGFRPLDVAYKRVSLTSTVGDGKVYFNPRLTIGVVALESVFEDISAIPVELQPHLSVERKAQQYLPVLYTFDNWQLNKDRIRLESDVQKQTLEIDLIGRNALWLKIMTKLGHFINALEQKYNNNAIIETLKWSVITVGIVPIVVSTFIVLAGSVYSWNWRGKIRSSW